MKQVLLAGHSDGALLALMAAAAASRFVPVSFQTTYLVPDRCGSSLLAWLLWYSSIVTPCICVYVDEVSFVEEVVG